MQKRIWTEGGKRINIHVHVHGYFLGELSTYIFLIKSKDVYSVKPNNDSVNNDSGVKNKACD